LDILNLLIKTDPQTVEEPNGDGALQIHIAVGYSKKSLEFCKILISAFPDSVRVGTNNGALPIHEACKNDCLETVKYLLELYPESITMRDQEGYSPLHRAASNCKEKAGEVIRFLLSRDSTCASMVTATHTFLPLGLPLHVAGYHLNLDAVQLLFDAHPEAICVNDGNGRTLLDIAGMPRLRGRGEENASEVVTFLEAQMAYVRKAQDIIAMQTPDDNNRLPLHHALFNNASLGAIKLLVKGNPLACQVSDVNKDSPLHIACRGGNCGAVKYLLERNTSQVSEQNVGNKLPIHLLCESGTDKVDRESPEFVETIWHLLKAHHETVLI